HRAGRSSSGSRTLGDRFTVCRRSFAATHFRRNGPARWNNQKTALARPGALAGMVNRGAVMMSPAEIENLLQRLGHEWPENCSLVDAVGQRIQSESIGIEQSQRVRMPRVKWLMAAAAAALVLGALWWAVHRDTPLYAQAIEGIKAARTVYITA